MKFGVSAQCIKNAVQHKSLDCWLLSVPIYSRFRQGSWMLHSITINFPRLTSCVCIYLWVYILDSTIIVGLFIGNCHTHLPTLFWMAVATMAPCCAWAIHNHRPIAHVKSFKRQCHNIMVPYLTPLFPPSTVWKSIQNYILYYVHHIILLKTHLKKGIA